ncbi:MAG: FdtA/QdtA family cupin domain-containing protein [Gammaproteobacteria bacterium]
MKVNSRINKCNILDIPMINDDRGNLSFIQNPEHIPFEIARIYYLYNVPSNKNRGSHAHKKLSQLIIAISGSFDVTINDGINKKKIRLNDASKGLYICPMIWRDLNNFTEDAVCMVLASHKYDQDDYIHDFNSFLNQVKIA